MVILQFLLFFICLYLLGRGLLIIHSYFLKKSFKNFENIKVFDLDIQFFFPIFGLIFIGNLVVLANFFIGVNNNLIFTIFFSLILLNFRYLKKLSFNFIQFINYILLPSILSISTHELGLHPDTGLYHLNYQNWIRSEKIAIGLTNINERFGYSSIYDHISSVLWYGDNFILLHFLNLSFIVILFQFLSKIIFSQNKTLFMSGYFIILFGILDNFGFQGGRNGFIYIEGIGKQDVAFAVIFFISNLLLINAIKNKDFNITDFYVSGDLLLFLIQIRIFGFLTLFLYVYYFLGLSDFKIKNCIKNLKFILPPFILGIIWMIKNVLISSCLFFPVESTCIHQLKWNKFEHADNAAYIVQDFYYALPTEDGLMGWYNHWFSSPHNATLTKNFIISFTIIFILRHVFFKNSNKNTLLFNLSISLYVFMSFYLWIYNAPAIRLAMGTLLVIVSYLGLGELKLRFNNRLFNLYKNKNILILLILVCTVLVPRFYKYKDFILNPLENYYVGVEVVETVKNPRGWGVIPKEGNECEINLECVPYEVEVSLNYSKNFNYKIFIPPEVWAKYGS